MAVQVSESQPLLASINVVIGVIDGCNESDRAVRGLTEEGLRPEDIRMFHGHHMPEHMDATGERLGQLNHTLRYLQELLSIDGSMLSKYEEHGNAGRHVLLIHVHGDVQVKELAAALASRRAHTVRVLGCWHIGELRPMTAVNRRPASGRSPAAWTRSPFVLVRGAGTPPGHSSPTMS